MSRPFAIKSLEIDIRLESDDSGKEVNKTIKGLACEAKVIKPGGEEKNSAEVKISGLAYTDLVSLTTLSFVPMESQKNLITIKAGDEGGEMSQVFAGEISSAWANFNSSPDVRLEIKAQSGFYPQRKSAPPLSVNGQAQAADLIAQQAGEIGYDFKNEGVTASVINAVFNGSPLEKAAAIAEQVGAELIIDDNEIIILPADGTRQGQTPLLGDDNGLIGYPTFHQDGISCKCLYRNDLEWGGLVEVKSIVPRASGTWKITKLTHELAAYNPNSKNWFTSIEGQHVG